MRTLVVLAIALLFVSSTGSALPPADDDKGFDPSKLVASAALKGGEYAAKAAAGFFYDVDCKDRNLTGSPMQYICGALGSFSGRTEAEWKAKVTEQLTKISAQLDTMEAGQAQIQRQLTTQHKVMETKFNQVASNVVAATHVVSIEGLWNKYKDQFDKVDKDLEPASMLAFATEIIDKKPQTILDELNVLLTTPVLEGHSLVRYPFHEWRLTHVGIPVDQIKAMDVYDFAEKKFADFRGRQEKAYLMYLWAAKVFEAQCALHPDKCVTPPRSTKDLLNDWNRYTRQQVEAFNAAVDWFVLSNSMARVDSTGRILPAQAAEMFLRANFLASSMLSADGDRWAGGLWGRVISMGNAWDGSLEVACGAVSQTLKPILKYDTPVAGTGGYFSGADSGALDWWVSSKGNAVFDEVRFADSWRIYHYNLPKAAVGPCTIAQSQPGAYLPWVEPGAKVVTIKTSDKRSVPFGSFNAIQRAGGGYALMSGTKWDGSMTPLTTEDGLGSRKKTAYDWFIEPNHPTGPWIGLYVKGRGEFSVMNRSSRIHNQNIVKVFQTKLIRFPDDPAVTINFFPANCKGQFCNASTSILSYDIENNDTEAKKGQLESFVAVSFREPGETALFPTLSKNGRGILLNGSYGKTGDRKTLDLKGPQTGIFTPESGKRYQLTYAIYFDLHTEGRGLDASEYMYRALLAPGSIYLTK